MPRRMFVPFLLALAPVGCSNETRINGGGASFVYPLMLLWTKVYDDQFHVQIDYQSTGSGNGQQQMIAQTINFGCTDAPISDDNLKKARAIGGEVLHVPLVLGAVVPIYHVPGVGGGLQFTGEIIADMYLGKIVWWDDPALTRINAGAKLPHEKIDLVRRADASGTTAIFTDYLAKVSGDWTKEMTGTSPSWPKTVQIVGVRGNEGIAGFVQRTAHSFGYVELIYAKQNNLDFGAVRNQQGGFVRASLESVTSAAAASREAISKQHADLRFSLTNAPGDASYPISGVNWAVLYQKQPAEPGRKLTAFLRWATQFGGEGQRLAESLGYAPLPQWLAAEVEAKLDAIEYGE
jgi:phosphate ABC transporter phosphate-binding protein